MRFSLLEVQRILNKLSSPNQHACVYPCILPLAAKNVPEERAMRRVFSMLGHLLSRAIHSENTAVIHTHG
jgi:hypothetical protein